jgi:hypothetical protein
MIPTAQQVVRSAIDTSRAVLFVATANSLDRLSEGLLNRLVVIHMQPVTVTATAALLAEICAREGVAVDRALRARLSAIAADSCGDVRLAINSLQRRVMCRGRIEIGDPKRVEFTVAPPSQDVPRLAVAGQHAGETEVERSVTGFVRSADGCRSRLQSLAALEF